MKYKLQFVKISPQHQFAGVGFAGNIFIVLNALTYLKDNGTLFVDMETNECACTEKELLHDTNNCWEYYFTQTPIVPNESFAPMNSLLAANIHYGDKNSFMNPNDFMDLKKKFYHSFQLKPYLVNLIDTYYTSTIKEKPTLGVQIRLTDMKHHHNVSGIESYVNKINYILNLHKEITQIFLATDDSRVVHQLKSRVSIPVISHDNMFRADDVNQHLMPYDRFHDERIHHRYNLGVECLKEIFTLSKCDYLLKADISSISIVSVILSENIKKVYSL